jgi:hypothetical protein
MRRQRWWNDAVLRYMWMKSELLPEEKLLAEKLSILTPAFSEISSEEREPYRQNTLNSHRIIIPAVC